MTATFETLRTQLLDAAESLAGGPDALAGILSGMLTVNADTLDLVQALMGRRGNGNDAFCRIR